jgi:hypothetical protein
MTKAKIINPRFIILFPLRLMRGRIAWPRHQGSTGGKPLSGLPSPGSMLFIAISQKPEPVGIQQEPGDSFIGGKTGLSGGQVGFQGSAAGQ